MRSTPLLAALAAAVVPALAATANPIEVVVTVENLSPAHGTYLTPVWLGFHDGMFDTFDAGGGASSALERLAEDGNATELDALFGGSGHGAASGLVLPGGPFAPGDVASTSFMLDGNDATSRFLSFASMVIPSNDAFIGNDDAMAHRIFADDGTFVGTDFFVTGAQIWDAGTEVNDELPENTAFFGQSMPNTGTPEGGVVAPHVGFLGSAGNPGVPSILADPMFAGADFTLDGYPVARITVTAVPAPSALALLGLAGLAGRRRRA